MIILISVFVFIHLIYNPNVVQCIDVYTIIRFNDIWYESYNYSASTRQNYMQQKFDYLYISFQKVTDYTLELMLWHYLKKGSVTHGVYITITKANLFPRTNSVTAVKNAIMNAYPDATILFAQEDIINVAALRIFKINIICTFNQTWMNDYNDLTSYNSKLFINNFDTKIKAAFNQIYRLSLPLDTLTSLRQGSVIANLNLYVVEGTYSLYEYQIRDSINSAFEIAYDAIASIQIVSILPYDLKSQKSNIYTIIKFNDTWNDSYVTSPTVLQSYINQMHLKLYASFQSVNDYELQQMSWHYLKKGSIIHGVNITIMKLKQVTNTNSTTALQNAIFNAYSNVSILFLKEDQIINRSLQIYQVNITCTMNQTWLNDYNNLSTYNSKLFINDFEIKIRSTFNQIYRISFMMVRFASLRQGSVIANLNLYLNETTYPLYEYQIRDSISSAFEIAYETNASIRIETIEPYNVSAEKSSVYTICKFNDAWSDLYVYSETILRNYIQQKFDTLYTSFQKVTNYQLQEMDWYYLKKGSVTHAFYLHINKINPVSSMNSTTAVKDAILNAYPDASILLLQEGKLNTSTLQQYKINILCTFNQIWLSDYNDLSSSNSKLFITNFETNMKSAFNQLYKLKFAYVAFTSLRQGSVIADLNLYVNETTAPLYEYQIRDFINSSFEIAYNTQASVTNVSIQFPGSTTEKSTTITTATTSTAATSTAATSTITTTATSTNLEKTTIKVESPSSSIGSNKDTPVGLIIGIVVGVILLIVIVIIVVVIYFLKIKPIKKDDDTYDTINYGYSGETVSVYYNNEVPKKGYSGETVSVYYNNEVPKK